MTCTAAPAQEAPTVPGGALQIIGEEGATAGTCPLKYTDVQADICGFLARVHVRQVFHNPTDRKIEAIYVFPLPQDAAVDDMVMTVGDRRIVGQIRERQEARAIYEAARAAGHVAGLLDQERPNIFTQSVANIEPGAEVTVEIGYVETLKYDDGVFEWVFPMVVGPRYIPGQPTSKIPAVSPGQEGKVAELDRGRVPEGPEEPQGTGWAPDTDQVPDASRVTPPVVKPGFRAGHDVSLAVHLDTGGLPLDALESVLHEIETARDEQGRAAITLARKAEIPNKDFILRYTLAAEAVSDAFLVHEDPRGRFFTLVLMPPRRVAPAQVLPRELIFVLDTSGSMSGLPIEKAKELMSRLIDSMQAHDTFNIITFSGDTRILWDQPRPASAANIAEAQKFLARREGSGGTEMMKAIEAALRQPISGRSDRRPPLRIACFMTDGYVGNDMAIIDAVKRYAGTTRVFSFGIGNGVNRFLLDGMALAGRGEVEYVALPQQADAAVERFHERVLAPVLTDIAIDWGTLPVADVVPALIPDLFSAKPILIHGRLTGPPAGTIVLRGRTAAGPYEERIDVRWPEQPPDHAALPSLWARARVAELMLEDYAAAQRGEFPEELRRQVLALGLEYRLMTQFTSFVAVEELTVTAGGEPVTITVPVEMPEGVSYEGVFGQAAYGPKMSGAGGMFPADPGMQLGAAVAARAAPATSPPRRTAAAGRVQVEHAVVGTPSLQERAATQPPSPEEAARLKLAEPLRELAGKVTKEGRDGTLAVGRLKVVNWRVDVMVYLADASAATLDALKKLGFEQTGESKALRMLTGTIDVRKLEDLARLEAVISIRPVVSP